MSQKKKSIKTHIKRQYRIQKKILSNSEIKDKLGPGSYNPDCELIKSKVKTMMLYKMGEKNIAIDKVYSYLDEIQAMKAPNYDIIVDPDPIKKVNNIPIWRKPDKERIIEHGKTPGPGSYDANDKLVFRSINVSSFGTQKRDVGILNKYNNLLIKTGHERPIPGVGTYFKGNFFKWKHNSYPSKLQVSSRFNISVES